MEDKTELNRAHFDNEAANYDAKHENATAEIARRLESRLSFIGVEWIEGDSSEDEEDEADAKQPARAVRLLDYACGTGAMSRIFAPYTTQCVGIDLSEKMVDAYNARARNQGLTEDEMIAYHGNLCVPSDADPPAFRDANLFFNFDMAIVGLGFHHFDDPQLAAERLVARLKPGGVLVIMDFLPHGHGYADSEASEMQKAMQTVAHHGFTEGRIREIFVRAGAGKDFGIDRMGEVTMGMRHGRRDLFMARGTKV